MVLFAGAAAAVVGAQLWLWGRLWGRRLQSPESGRLAIRRATGGESGWILQGTGRYACNLRFSSWEEAIQAAAELAAHS